MGAVSDLLKNLKLRFATEGKDGSKSAVGTIQRYDPISTAIEDIVYDPSRQEARVVYKNGNGKDYVFPMTDEEYKAMKASDSKGKWFAYNARRYANYNKMGKKGGIKYSSNRSYR